MICKSCGRVWDSLDDDGYCQGCNEADYDPCADESEEEFKKRTGLDPLYRKCAKPGCPNRIMAGEDLCTYHLSGGFDIDH